MLSSNPLKQLQTGPVVAEEVVEGAVVEVVSEDGGVVVLVEEEQAGEGVVEEEGADRANPLVRSVPAPTSMSTCILHI